MDYYAHINRKTGMKESELAHLLKTADLCQQFAGKMGYAKEGYLLGLTHDAGGKHTVAFQEVLQGKRTHVNHAYTSAAILANEFSDLFRDEESKIIAYNCEKGHHNGFGKDYIFDSDLFEDMVEEAEMVNTDYNCQVDGKYNAISSAEEYDQSVEFVRNLINDYTDISEALSLIPEEGFRSVEEKMLSIRLIMSCLVDADYTATASFEGMKDESDYDVPASNFKDMLEKLDKYRNVLIKGTDQNHGINLLRNYVYKCAGDAGQNSHPGFFTMTAPTGTAKTLAFIKFALEMAVKNNMDRIFIVVPYLTITEQTVALYKKIFGENAVFEDDSQTELNDKTRLYAERWTPKIIITTNKKFYETLFSSTPSVLRKLHNIINSIIVFDESQSLRTDLADITINTLKELTKYNTAVVLSTATPPAYGFREGINYNPLEIIQDVAWLYSKYNEIRTNVIVYSDKTWDYGDLSDIHENINERLYILNTTSKAYAMYRALCAKYGDACCFLLYKNLCPSHKRKILKEIRDRLNEHEPCYVASTQCVEAGVDIDFPCLIREFAPLPALVQSFGRLNRNCKGKGVGLVFSFSKDAKGGYPDTQYRNETMITLYMTERYDWNLDINNENVINEYYNEIFSQGGLESADKKIIQEALEECNLGLISENYKIIDNDQQAVSIIVPFHDEINRYRNLADRFSAQDMVITKMDMRDARAITVSIYASGATFDKIISGCEQLKLSVAGVTVPTNWYILSESAGMYNNKTGLDAGNDVSSWNIL